MTRTFWLSFCDTSKRAGSRFLGVAVVDVTEAEAAHALMTINETHPQHAPGAEWIAAAVRKAWATGCNPGGQVASADVTDDPNAPAYPRNRLLSRADLDAGGWI